MFNQPTVLSSFHEKPLMVKVTIIGVFFIMTAALVSAALAVTNPILFRRLFAEFIMQETIEYGTEPEVSVPDYHNE